MHTDAPAALLLAALLAAATPAGAAEACRFEGATDHAGHVSATTDVAVATDGAVSVDVALDLRATAWWVLDIRYLVEEISTWRGGELVQVAVNTRSLSAGRIVRQQWDVFRREGDGLEARRVQAKTLAQFRERHPGFVAHWDPATFGQAWLPGYDAAGPERRPDLDLPRAAAGLRTPLAMAFYWTRWLPARAGAIPVFLPGFKRDATLTLDPAPAAPGADAPAGALRLWQVPLRHPALDPDALSDARAWVSADHHLLELAFALHGRQGSARGTIHATGCRGSGPGWDGRQG